MTPVSPSDLATAAKAAQALHRRFKKPDPLQVLKRRAEVRDEIRKNLEWPSKDEVPEVLIVRLDKHDRYGAPDNRLIARGASNWFKAEVKGMHDRGLECYSSIEYVVIRKGKARRVSDESAPGARKVWVVGRIPYERVAYIDWGPDPAYGAPRFYVTYDWRHEAFREIALYEAGWGDDRYELYDVKYKGEGGGPWKRMTRVASHIRFMLASRREQRRFRNGQYR